MAVIVLTSQERVGNIYTSFSSHEHNENTSLPNEITGPKVGRCQEEEKGMADPDAEEKKKRSETRKKTNRNNTEGGEKKRLLLQRNAKLVTVSSLLKCSFASWNNSHGFSSKEKKKRKKKSPKAKAVKKELL